MCGTALEGTDTSPTTVWPPRSSWRWCSSARSSSKGEPGGGKTEVANALSRWTGGELVRLQCYEGIDVSQAVYEWDFARQLLHLRAAELRGPAGDGAEDVRTVEDELFSERFLVRRPLLRAIMPSHRNVRAAGADHRRSRPGRRRVRGVPSRGPGRLLGDGPRARDVPGRGAAARRADVESHPRRARRPQAAVPLPLGGASGLRTRGGHRAPQGARSG